MTCGHDRAERGLISYSIVKELPGSGDARSHDPGLDLRWKIQRISAGEIR